MNLSIKELESDLNVLYKYNLVKYKQKLNTIKDLGYKVYRNADGDHVIKRNENFINECFGGVFGKIFKGEN